MRQLKMSDGRLLLFPVFGIVSLILAFGTSYLSPQGKIFSVVGACLLLFSSVYLIQGSFSESVKFKKGIGKKKFVLYFLLSCGMLLCLIGCIY